MRFIFTEYANGTDKKEIADELNKRHILYKGKPFTFRTFENWLSNAKYTGEFMHGQRLCANTYTAIIDKATFAKVQERLQQNKILAGANSAIEPYLLTGKAFCGHCGTAMIASGGARRVGKKHFHFLCFLNTVSSTHLEVTLNMMGGGAAFRKRSKMNKRGVVGR